MVRIGLRPAWVGVLDFQQRFPEMTPHPCWLPSAPANNSRTFQ
jgi:hypothetical protein